MPCDYNDVAYLTSVEMSQNTSNLKFPQISTSQVSKVNPNPKNQFFLRK